MKKPHLPPSVIPVHGKDLVPTQPQVAPIYTAILDSDRTYVRVSDNFCKLLGYTRKELLGKQADYVTPSNTVDIPTVYETFKKVGYSNGLWLLANRSGDPILVRYEARLRPDSYIESSMQLLLQCSKEAAHPSKVRLHHSSEHTSALSRLSTREIQTLELLANGQSNREIAANLGLGVRTVETHRARMMLKLGIHSVSQLVQFAVQSGVINID